MAAAHDLLRERAVKARQLSQAQRRSLVFAKPAALIIGLLLSSVFAIGMASLFAHILGHSLGSIALQNRAYVSFSAGVALVALYAAVIVRTWREHRALTVAFCAVPPLIPNAPALCHICAAELTAPRGASIARCGYCFADNIVDIVWLQAKKKRLKLVFDDFIDEVARRAQQAERRHGRRRRLLLFAFFMAPPLAVASIQLLQTYAERRTARYVVVETGGAHCIARVAYSILGGRCIIGGPTRDAETCTLDRSVPEYQKDWDIHAFNDQVNLAVGVPDYAASAFVGRQVWVHYGVVGALKSVQKARGSRAHGYVAEIEISEGTRVKHKLSELCIHRGKLPQVLFEFKPGTLSSDHPIAVGNKYVVVGLDDRLLAVAKNGEATYRIDTSQAGQSYTRSARLIFFGGDLLLETELGEIQRIEALEEQIQKAAGRGRLRVAPTTISPGRAVGFRRHGKHVYFTADSSSEARTMQVDRSGKVAVLKEDGEALSFPKDVHVQVSPDYHLGPSLLQLDRGNLVSRPTRTTDYIGSPEGQRAAFDLSEFNTQARLSKAAAAVQRGGEGLVFFFHGPRSNHLERQGVPGYVMLSARSAQTSKHAKAKALYIRYLLPGVTYIWPRPTKADALYWIAQEMPKWFQGWDDKTTFDVARSNRQERYRDKLLSPDRDVGQKSPRRAWLLRMPL